MDGFLRIQWILEWKEMGLHGWMDGIDGFDIIKAIDGNFWRGEALSSALLRNSGNSGIVE